MKLFLILSYLILGITIFSCVVSDKESGSIEESAHQVKINADMALQNVGREDFRPDYLDTILAVGWSQAEIELSGLDLRDLPFEKHYPLSDGISSYQITIQQYGLSQKIKVFAETQEGGSAVNRQQINYLVQEQALDSFPAMGILNRNISSNIAMAGSSEIVGPAMLWRGRVSKVSFGDVAYTGNTGTVEVWGDSSHVWQTLPLVFTGVQDWVARQDSLLEAVAATQIVQPDLGFDSVDVLLGDAVFNSDSIANKQIICSGVLTLSGTVQVTNALILAQRVLIEETPQITNSLVYAGKDLQLSGSPSLSGQFVGRDSMRINCQAPFQDSPVFYVHGHMYPEGYKGTLHVENATGNVVVLFGGADRGSQSNVVNLVVDSLVNLQGLVYANGHANMRGSLAGSFIAEALRFTFGSTVYTGHLKDGKLEQALPGAMLSLPYVFSLPSTQLVLRSFI